MLRVVNLGLPKTGTTTLARALRRAGLKVADRRIRRRSTSDAALKGQFVAELLYRGYFQSGDPGALLSEIDAISEMSLLREDDSLWPQMDFALIMALRVHNPGLKFLASCRDPFELSQSMLAWSDLGMSRLPNSAIPGLPRDYGQTTKERMQWIRGHYAALARFFGDDPDYLTYDIADPLARDRIGDFLGLELPWWGRLNANPVRAGASAT
ncbi:sulfotransferase family protein [Sedimentitalea xiamensis]|uniref:hypothetical protein n=1 Tax=Sedimentitalea xiamensis TaxID=3050037 RepID=UPI002AA2B06E|nr:hypothetical protein [Sedimentitalea xiamensis]